MPNLIIRQDGKTVTSVNLENDEYTLGRQGDVVLADAKVSRKHARIFKDDDGKYAIENLTEQNVTLLNGLEIKREHLNDHDEIQIANFIIMFNLSGASEASSGGAMVGDPMATDVTGRGVMTFDESDNGDLADKLRGMLQQAKQEKSTGHTFVAQKSPESSADVASTEAPAAGEASSPEASVAEAGAGGNKAVIIGVAVAIVAVAAIVLLLVM